MLASGPEPLLSPVSGEHGQLALESRPDPAFPRFIEDAVQQQRTILIADPDPALRGAWRNGLAAMGFHVRESTDGGGALATAMRCQVDLLVTELYLPTSADRCLVQATRREVALRRMKILVVSDHATATDRSWALAAGADAYLVKPVRLGRVLQVAGQLATSRGRSRGEGRAPDAQPRIDGSRPSSTGGRREDVRE